MKTKKKNKFLTFCCSLLPGAGEMYMGFMKTGVSLMLLFFISGFTSSMLRMDALITVAIVVWFYGFFHANHLAGLTEEEFAEVEDNYLFGIDILTGGKDFVGKYHKWIAGGLIFIGILLLWNTATDIAYHVLPEYIYQMMNTIDNYVPRVLVAILIILIGIKMICGRKKQLAQMEGQTEEMMEKGE